MRGSPLLRFLAIGIFLALAGLPIWSLTHREEAVLPIPAFQKPENHDIELTVTSTREAVITIAYAGGKILQSPAATASLTGKVSLPATGADLILTAAWPDASAPNAIRVIATCDGVTLGDTTFWGDSSVEDVFVIGGTP